MAGILKSLLAPALKKLAAKGENIAINRLPDALLKEQGLRKDEIDVIAPNFKKVDTTVSKSGNTLITPQGLKELEETIPSFKTTEETQFDREQLDFERLARLDNSGLADHDAESETILDRVSELISEKEAIVDRALGDAKFLNPDELDALQREADILQDEINNLDSLLGDRATIRNDIIDSIESTEYKFDDFYESISPDDVDPETYGISVVRDPRDNVIGESVHLSSIGRKNYSYHMRFDIETDEQALRVFEMQRDIDVTAIPDIQISGQYNIFKEFPQEKFGGSGNKWDKENWYLADPVNWGQWSDDVDLRAFSKEDLQVIRDKVDEISDMTRSKMDEDKGIKELNNIWADFSKMESNMKAGMPKLDYYQNLINRALVKADNEGLNKVKFFIGNNTPESIEYMGLKKGEAAKELLADSESKDLYTVWENKDPKIPLGYLSRSFPIQNHYENVVAKQIQSTAKKIGASIMMDKKGYLVVGLPAAGFTLPLYGEENKEDSFLATAVGRGESREEAEAMLSNVSRFPFADSDKVLERVGKNTGGKILGSLSRTRKAEGGKPPHRGYFKPVKELLIDNKDKEFVKRILNPALNDTLKRDKSVASNETHRMAAEVDEKGNWYVFPNVINKEGTLTKSKNPMKAALDNNEYIFFGKDKDQALWFAADNYKTQEFRDHHK